MLHRISHKRLSRDTNARAALLKNLATSLVLHERITTTTAKAKTIRPVIEKLITKAKVDSHVTRRYLLTKLDKKSAVNKMLELIGPTFKERAGGYTRIIKLAPRAGDNADLSMIEFVENISEIAAKKKLTRKTPVNLKKEGVRKAESKKTAKVKPKDKINPIKDKVTKLNKTK